MKGAAIGIRQHGAVWWIFLLSLALGAAHLLRLLVGLPDRASPLMQMAQAKEALIARAVNDANRPGSLPCPDRLTNSAAMNNVPGDGRADLFTLSRCPTYVGWLPWATLELPATFDGSGNRLWYVLAPGLRDDDSAQPINSNTPTGLQLDDTTEIAALVIAGGPPLAGQRRPSAAPGDHLDAANGDGDDHRYVSRSSAPGFNDRILALTGRELMAAVGKRVAAEVAACLAAHAASPSNAMHRYPWPAPPGGPTGRGTAGTLFGRLPTTEPGSGPQAVLGSTQTTLNGLGQRLGAGEITADLDPQFRELQAGIVHARNLADGISVSANRVTQAGQSAQTQLARVNEAVISAVDNDRISVTEGRTIRALNATAREALATVDRVLDDTGFDPHPWHSRRLAGQLAASSESGQRMAAIGEARTMLAASWSARPDVSGALTAAAEAAELAQDAVSATANGSPDQPAPSSADAAIARLSGALRQLADTVDASRCRVGSGDMEELADLLASSAMPLPLDRVELASQRVAAVACSPPAVAEARRLALIALQAGRGGAPEKAAEALRQLAAAIGEHEAIDGNLTRSSLIAAEERYTSAATIFTEIDTRLPRPIQRQIVPYAEAVGTSTVNLSYWTKIVAEQAIAIAPATQQATQAAAEALATLNGRNGSLTLLDQYLSTPTPSRLVKAEAARRATLDALKQLTAYLAGLEALATSGPAGAAPMVWAAARCDFLRPGASDWWANNAWHDTVFYQIGHPLSAGPARLAVNGRLRYRLVTVAAGRALAGQSRGPAASISAYLDGKNADASRDGHASSPVTEWYGLPPSGDFNDRLAYRP